MIVERLDPFTTDDAGNRELHLERYRWAAPRVHGADVLDAACGVGYGTALLADGPGRSALGIDRDGEAIRTATERHASGSVRFERAADVATFAGSAVFDTVVSLETLEHLEAPLVFLQRVHGLLRPGGRLIVSAPVQERPGDNPHHLHCFTAASLEALVGEGFEVEERLEQAGGAYVTLAARRRDAPCAAWVRGEGPPRSTVVLVTHDEPEAVLDLARAVRHLAGRPHDLLVIDNASSAATRSLVRLWSGAPGVSVVLNQENMRCAAATNQALAQVRTELVVYLCASHALPVREGWLGALEGFLDANPEVSLAGDLWAPGFAVPSTRYAPGWSPDAHVRELLHVQGGAWIARRSLFEEVGDFAADEHPHAGMDVELSYRLQSLGLGRLLGACPAVHAPPSPGLPVVGPGVFVVHPATPAQRAATRALLARAAGVEPPARAAAIVFCERLDNESFCESIVRELEAHVEVRPCGPGWPTERLEEVDTTGVRFFLELDSVSGSFVRPAGLERLTVPKLAWLVDTHKKTEHHRRIASEVDLTFVAHRSWGHALGRPWAWLPLHADGERFRPVEAERRWDVVFVGSQPWRAEALEELGRRHGLRILVTTTTGPREKSETAAIYAQARLVFNRHVANDLNFRVFEAVCCGRVLLTDAQPNGQYELFEDDEQVVYYKDDQDLERLVLELLADDARRARIEAAAAECAREHTTRARVAKLLDEAESILGVALRDPPPALAASPCARPARWLVVGGEPAPTADLLGAAPRLARALAERGHEVVLACARRSVAGDAPAGLEEALLDAGPLPVAATPERDRLAAAGPLHRQLEELARARGPFDAVVVEGPLGQLVGPPLAERLAIPLHLVLPACEVHRRDDRLTREQLHAAELEHWAARQARHVVVTTPEVEQAVRRHYGVRTVRVDAPPPRERLEADDVARLVGRLGLEAGRFVLVVSDDDLPGGLGARAGGVVVWSGARTWIVDPRGAHELVGEQARGPALAALLQAAAVVVIDPRSPARPDARALAARLVVARPRSLEEALDASRAAARPAAAADPCPALEALLAWAPASGGTLAGAVP